MHLYIASQYIYIIHSHIHVCMCMYMHVVINDAPMQHKPTPRKHEDGVRGAGYTPIVKENERFVKYYQVISK